MENFEEVPKEIVNFAVEQYRLIVESTILLENNYEGDERRFEYLKTLRMDLVDLGKKFPDVFALEKSAIIASSEPKAFQIILPREPKAFQDSLQESLGRNVRIIPIYQIDDEDEREPSPRPSSPKRSVYQKAEHFYEPYAINIRMPNGTLRKVLYSQNNDYSIDIDITRLKTIVIYPGGTWFSTEERRMMSDIFQKETIDELERLILKRDKWTDNICIMERDSEPKETAGSEDSSEDGRDEDNDGEESDDEQVILDRLVETRRRNELSEMRTSVLRALCSEADIENSDKLKRSQLINKFIEYENSIDELSQSSSQEDDQNGIRSNPISVSVKEHYDNMKVTELRQLCRHLTNVDKLKKDQLVKEVLKMKEKEASSSESDDDQKSLDGISKFHKYCENFYEGHTINVRLPSGNRRIWYAQNSDYSIRIDAAYGLDNEKAMIIDPGVTSFSDTNRRILTTLVGLHKDTVAEIERLILKRDKWIDGVDLADPNYDKDAPTSSPMSAGPSLDQRSGYHNPKANPNTAPVPGKPKRYSTTKLDVTPSGKRCCGRLKSKKGPKEYCTLEVHAKGMCKQHYATWKKKNPYA